MRKRWPSWVAGCLSLLVLAMCNHEWDAYLPPADVGASATGSTSSSASGTGGAGTGGAGGTVIVGDCPPAAAGTTALVRVGTLAGSAMCIDATEVTRGQYETWLGAPMGSGGAGGGGYAPPPQCSWNMSFTPTADWPPMGVDLDLPISHVDWCDAHAYCGFSGKRLCGGIDGAAVGVGDFDDPALSEWFNVCTTRGTLVFPYGDAYEPMSCNGQDSGMAARASVGTFPDCRSNAAVFDLSGNVWEWVATCDGDVDDMDGCRIRGGGFNNAQSDLACAADSRPLRSTTSVVIGFRCCADPIP